MTKPECESEFHEQYEWMCDQLLKLGKRYRKKFPDDTTVFFLGCLNSCVVKTITASAPDKRSLEMLLADTTREGMQWGKALREEMQNKLED